LADPNTGPIHIFDSLASTNAYALEQLNGPAWVMARVQTAGRGRRARPWSSPLGNLYATHLLHPTEPPATVALRSFAAALALHSAIFDKTGHQAALKWPNDVLVNGGKVAGILLEATRRQSRPCLAIGFGVNLISAPDASVVEAGATVPISLQAATGQTFAPEDFLTALAQSYAHWEEIFQTQGFAPLRAAWLNRAARIGQLIRARTGTATHVGLFDTIDDDGNLILTTAQGTLAIPAADVFF
jgi:BirA family transcriptional regulator, biotin operon repressor / biotin---[acetyl-CoA-carboxylase] ligase